MGFDISPSLVTTMLAVLPSQAVAMIVVVFVISMMFLALRKGSREDSKLRDEYQVARDVQLAADFTRLRSELERVAKRCDECDNELERVEEELRKAKWESHELRIARDQLIVSRDSLRHVITGLCEQLGKIPPEWPKDPVPLKGN